MAKTSAKEAKAQLAKRKIAVGDALFYFVKGKMKGVASKKKVAKAKRKMARRQIRRAANTTGSPVELILKVKALADEAGGIGQLKKLVEVLN